MASVVLDKLDVGVPTPLKKFFGNDDGRVVLLTSLLSLFAILPVGYSMVILNVPQSIILRSFHSSFSALGLSLNPGALSVIWSITVSCQAIGALVGCALVARTESVWGTKKASFGAAMGAILSLDFMLGGETTWGILVLLPGLLALVGMSASFFVPGRIIFPFHLEKCQVEKWVTFSDTPNYLLQRGAYSEAIDSIIFYYDVTRLFNEDEDIVQHYFETVTELPPQAPFPQVLQRPDALKGILLGCVVSATQVFSGSMVSISYSSTMFNAVYFFEVLVPYLPALGSILSIILTIPALQLVESRGRRPMLLLTLSVCIVADVLLLVFSLLSRDDWWASWAFGVAFFLFGIGYNMGTGPIAYFLPGELVSSDAVTSALGTAVAVNWICSVITTVAFFPLNVAFGGWSYLLFIVPTTILTFILWLFLPETKFDHAGDSIHNKILQDLGPSYGSLLDETT